MTAEDIKKKIDAIGNIKVIFEPKSFKKDLIPQKNLETILEKSQVSLRGWNFPHLPLNNKDDSKKPYSIGNGVEFYTHWERITELFRFYQSGQFTGKFALYEDIITELNGQKMIPGKHLDFLSLIYRTTETVLFVKNVIENTDIDGGIITLEINKTKERELDSIFSPTIPSFHSGYICQIEKIVAEEAFEREKILNHPLDIGLALIKKCFDDFNWKNYSEQMIRTHQENFINRRI